VARLDLQCPSCLCSPPHEGADAPPLLRCGKRRVPPPLTEDEERQMLERKEAGDEEARNILVERNLRLVAHVVKKYDVVGEETDDLISIGAIGLIKAINTFDRQKKTRLARTLPGALRMRY